MILKGASTKLGALIEFVGRRDVFGLGGVPRVRGDETPSASIPDPRSDRDKPPVDIGGFAAG